MGSHKREATRDNTTGGRTWNVGWPKAQLRVIPAESEWYRLENKLITYVVNAIYTNSGCTNPTNLNATKFINQSAKLSQIGLYAPENVYLVQRQVKFFLEPSGHQSHTTENVDLQLHKIP